MRPGLLLHPGEGGVVEVEGRQQVDLPHFSHGWNKDKVRTTASQSGEKGKCWVDFTTIIYIESYFFLLVFLGKLSYCC